MTGNEPRIASFDQQGHTGIVLTTSMGSIEISVCEHAAPGSSRAFLNLLERFARAGAFYRSVRKDQNDRGHPPIDVIQGGLREPGEALPVIEHESTSSTGLRHVDGAVSLARTAVGTATGAAFFICIGAQPALDAGGERHPDRLGYAVFGRVVSGMEVVRAIHQLPCDDTTPDPYLKGQLLSIPVRIEKAFRK